MPPSTETAAVRRRRWPWLVGVPFAAFGLLLWAIAPAPSEAPPLTGTFGEGSLRIGERDRAYEYYAPSGLRPGAPLLFVIHGSSMDADSTREFTRWRFEQLADEVGFLVVHPLGFEREWNGCRAPGVTQADRLDVDDVGFHLGLIDRFRESHGIDPARVVAVGFSNGGQMAYRLASDAPDRFAGVAVVIAGVPAPENSKCNAPRGPIPILIMNGDADPIIPYEGGIASFFFGISARGRILSAPESLAHWRHVNGLAGEAERRRFEDLDPGDGSWVESERYSAHGRPEVVLYTVHGGGHAFPGALELGSRWLSGPLVGYTNRDVDGAAEVWSFLARQLGVEWYAR